LEKKRWDSKKLLSTFGSSIVDERWLDWFDAKIALLINRDGVDPRDYGGKDYDEYVHQLPYHASHLRLSFVAS
jgi:hypothetical protein